MSVVNWQMLPADEIAEQDKPKVSSAFRRLVYAVSTGGRIKMLKPEEELELIRKWVEEEDPAARDRLVTCFNPMILPMARNIARYNGVPQYSADIYQVGLEAFLRSLPRYDPSKEARLSTFVRYRVSGDMLRFCLDMRLPLRICTSAYEKRAYYRYRAAIDAFRSEHGRYPNDGNEDIAALGHPDRAD